MLPFVLFTSPEINTHFLNVLLQYIIYKGYFMIIYNL